MRRLICTFALSFCAAASATTPVYRYQALIDGDHSAATGCDAATTDGVVHGIELRTRADTDRTTRLEVVTEVCVDGQWQRQGAEVPALPLDLGLGRLGSDRVEWPLDAHSLALVENAELRVFAENLVSGAHDRIGAAPDAVNGPAGGAGGAIPLLPPWAAVLLAGLLIAAALRATGTRGSRVGAVALCVGTLATPGAGLRADADASAIWLVDPANDSVGADAGVDLLGAGLVDTGAGRMVRIELNHIAADGLPDGARVLFLGNSLTFVNDLPGMVRAVAAQAGRTMVVGEVSEGGASLEDLYRAGDAKREIAKRYDLVILQQGPSALESSQADLIRWAKNFNNVIRSNGGRPALYMVWPERERFEVFNDVRTSYSNAATAVDGMFIPGGESWRGAWAVDPNLALYGPDDFHPSPLGTYAVALTVFAELFRQTPQDLPATLPLEGGRVLALDPAEAAIAQRAAWQAHLHYGRAGR